MKKYQEFKDYHESIGTIFQNNSYEKFMRNFMKVNKDLQEEHEKNAELLNSGN